MKLKRTALLSLGALIGFTLFYIGLNQWQHEKESTGKINIVGAAPQPQTPLVPSPTQPQPQTPQPNQTLPTTTPPTTQPTPSQAPTPQTTQTNQANQTQAPKSPKTTQEKTPKSIAQIIKEHEKSKPPQTPPIQSKVVFQIGAFKSPSALESALSKAKALGFEPIVKQEKGFYIVRVQLTNSNEGIKLLTAFPGAFRVH